MKRLLMHTPVGFINGWFMSLSPFYGLPFMAAFVIYEKNEEKWLRDELWRDIVGWLWGFGAFVVVTNLGGIL